MNCIHPNCKQPAIIMSKRCIEHLETILEPQKSMEQLVSLMTEGQAKEMLLGRLNKDKEVAKAAVEKFKKELIEDCPDQSNYHHQGMGCGLEDKGITDRYDAMYHGYECAMEEVHEFLKGLHQ